MSTPDKDIRYSITAEDRFSRSFQQLKRDIGGSTDQLGGLITKANMVSVALGTIAFGAIGAGGALLGVRRLINDLDSLNDAADATGSSVEKLSALDDVARRNGESLDTVASAVVKLNKVLNEAKPDSPMALALERIGLSAADLRNDDPSDALLKVARALSGFADDGNKARLIVELTGKSIKELAPLLKDLGEAGELNSRVTTEQAAQAEKFNKELFALQANSANAARSLVSDLVPALNQLFEDKRTGGLSKMLGLETFGAQIDQVVALYRGLSLARERITPLSILEKDPTNEKALAELARIDALAKTLGDDFKRANAERLKLVDNGAGAGRGFINPPAYRSSVGAPPADTAAATAPKISEAQRYLEQLQKQGEKLQDLTVYQQLLKDIEAKRIDGITPKLERELKIAAQRVDLQKQLNDEKEREIGFQKLLSDKSQRDIDEVQRLLEQTDTGRLQGIDNQADKLLDFSRRIGEGDPRQRQVIEALQRLKKEAQDIATPTDAAGKEFDKLADTIEKSMDRATGAVIDFAIEGKGSVTDLGRAFGRDILRSLIEDPVRETMKTVANNIKSILTSGDVLGSISKLFSSFTGSSSGDGWGALLKFIGGGNGAGSGGFTGRAGGGSVNAGDLVRWQENGREWFIPGADGSVVNQAQMRAMGGGGTVNQTNHFTIQGGDPREVQRQINAALARNNAQLARNVRLGTGALAG